MNKKILILNACLFTGFSYGMTVSAAPSDLEGKGTVDLEVEYTPEPVDPENPRTAVDPGVGPFTRGPLRFDFAPTLNFGTNKIVDTNRKFYANAQLFRTKTSARGNFIQVTNSRVGENGWSLQVRQEYQFRNDVIQKEDEKELKGAVLSFDHIWLSSAYQGKAPQVVSKDTIKIESQATTYPLVTAAAGEGKGKWSISFGASKTNRVGQPNTLFERKDENGKAILDPKFGNKQVYGNEAISLTIPDATKIYPLEYQTELTWIIGSLP